MTGIESMFWRHRGEREDWGINHCMLPTSISNRNTRQTMHKYGREAFFLGLSFILHQMKQNKNLKKKVFVFYSTFFQTTTTIWPITVQPRFHFFGPLSGTEQQHTAHTVPCRRKPSSPACSATN